MGLMGLMGCSTDVEQPVTEPASLAEIEVVGYATCFEEAERANGANGANRANGANEANRTYEAYEANRAGDFTRAWEIPSGYTAYEDGDQPIGVAFTQDGMTPEQKKKLTGYFFKSSGKWRTNIDFTSAAVTYYLYGYIPHKPAITFSVTDKNGNNTKYSEGAKVILQNVPTIMPGDLCVAIGAKHGFDKEHDGDYSDVNGNTAYDEGIDTRTNRLVKGDFKYTLSSSPTGNFVFLLFDHLYAALRINMRVYDDYAKLRTIKLKSLQMSTKAGDETTKQKNDITITLNHSDGGREDAIESIDYEQTGESIDGGIEFWSSPSGEELTTVFTEHVGHFMPSRISTLILTSVYDVYDRKGNLIRENCKVTNTMLLSNLLTGQTETQRGRRYTVNMTIRPTYLYMLSEPDLDNPTVTLE